jgi:nucleotide-binding universal stress UspA family protein
MAYQTVLVHLGLDPHCAMRVACAASLVAPGGLLVGAAMSGVSRRLYRGIPAADSDAYLALHLQFLREQANTALAAFLQQAAQPGMPAHDARLLDDEAASGLSLEARVADLLVLSHPETVPELIAQVLPQAGRPVLLLPAGLTPPESCGRQLGKRVLVAWDASREAGRALASALPILRQADLVELVVCAAGSEEGVARDVRMADPLPYLAHHGVQATLRVHAVAGGGRFHRDVVGEALLSVAAAGNVDLLVMGAYAHSRLRETLLGGVTRTVLARMTLPVLLEH